MVRAGIVGGAGYTAGELIRILLFHPGVELAFVQSSSSAGLPVSVIHDDLLGETSLKFTRQPPLHEIDVIFLCMGHGLSEQFLNENPIPGKVKIIDLSQDFRINYPGNPFVYGLPELNRNQIRNAARVANPGCFATGIELALLPLAANQLLTGEINVTAITGSTGAGQKPSPTTHFSWRNNNLSVYKVFDHPHEKEILQALHQLQHDFDQDFNFVPVRGNHTRGIFTCAYTRFDGTIAEAEELYQHFYSEEPFVVISERNPGLKQVVNTNKAIIYLEKHKTRLFIVSLIDNLLKGASGQAVQNMNLMSGIDEKEGLNLKPVAF